MLLRKINKDLQESIASGFLLQHDQPTKIAVDYAHKVGVIEGLHEAVRLIENIKMEIDDYERD